ncbi:hypothetical protein LCGC14_1367400, partial [marine sediment metagenome]
ERVERRNRIADALIRKWNVLFPSFRLGKEDAMFLALAAIEADDSVLAKRLTLALKLAWDADERNEALAKANKRLREAIDFFLEDGVAEDSPDLNQVAYMALVKALENTQPWEVASFDLVAFLQRHGAFTEAKFGPGRRTTGITNHIRKELAEIEAAPTDLVEWIDVILLALDGARRAGHTPKDVVSALVAKQVTNEGREWPDWRATTDGTVMEHMRDKPHDE